MTSIITMPFYSLHSHSKFSANDALPEVADMVSRAVELGYPALGLTDHGSVSGSIQLYKACRKARIEPMPGIELYVVPDSESAGRSDSLHLTVNAYNETGYRNLMKLATITAKRYWYKPQIDFADFAAMAEADATRGLAISTGCYFGIIPQVLMRQGHKEAVQVAQTLAGWFPRVYVELQNHGIDQHHSDLDFTDDELIAAVYDVGMAAGLPFVVTRDSHYINESDKRLHDALKQLVSWSDDPDEAIFPGGGYHMTDLSGLKEYFEPKYLDAGMEGLADLANAAYLRLPEMETFSLKIPDVSVMGTPQNELEAKVMDVYNRSLLPQSYLNQLNDEFDVIRTGGMAPYLLLVDMVCEFMREQKIRYTARGSAAGSLVNYLLDISQVDPIRFGLRFDRFMSSNRLKPPDVDLDIEHTRRGEVVAFLSSHWSVRSIGSHMKYSLFEDEEGDESKGSLRIRYYSNIHRQGLPKLAWRNIPERDKKVLYELAGLKLISGYGVHAAGYIVAPDEQALSQLPLAYIASSKKLVTAYGKKDVEQLGFLKLDLLGVRTQTAIRIMQELSGIEFDSIHDDDPATMKAISNGKTTGVFQLDGWSAQRGCERLKPHKISDVIAAMALFRPATQNSGATGDYLARRAKRDKPPQRHPDIMAATADTYGVLLYQESVMDVMQTLGMTSSQLESMLDAVKASNEYSQGAAVVIEEILPTIRDLAHKRAWTESDIQWLVDGLGAYADYCVTGDTVVWRSSGGHGQPQTVTVKEIYDTWYGQRTPTRNKYRATDRGLHILARDIEDDRVRPARVADVSIKGVQQVWTVRTESGRELTATGNHRHLTRNGWTHVSDLCVGDELAVMGEPEKWANSSSSGNLPSLHNGLHLLREEIKSIGHCEFCGETEGRLELAHLDGDRSHNARDNLKLLCNPCHKQHDWNTGQRQVRHSRGRAILYSPIESITDAGFQQTYDLAMLSDDHSWVANGIITHNSFNRAHATSYGVLAYRTAWMRTRHPAYFWTGMLVAYADHKKVNGYLMEARRDGVKILPPHVNHSSDTYTYSPSNKAIRRGLLAIKGVGPVAAAELAAKAPYSSLTDLGQRVLPRRVSGALQLALGKNPLNECGGVISALADADALDGLEA